MIKKSQMSWFRHVQRMVTRDIQENNIKQEVLVNDPEGGLEQLEKSMCRVSWGKEAIPGIRQEHTFSKGNSSDLFVHP